MRFADRIVVITGAAGGLGRAMTRAFVDEGAFVVATDIDAAGHTQLDPELGARTRFMALDVTDESQWITRLQCVRDDHGRLDVLVNNAGYFRPNVAFEEMPIELWRRHFAVNVDGVFLGCKHGIRHMKGAAGGAIVNVASGLGIKASATASAYCGSKAAVLMTTRTAAASAGQYDIRVNAVLPGPVPTQMLRGNLLAGQSESEYFSQLAGFAALGRLASAAEIASAVLFLSDPGNRSLTGAWLPVDGGDLPGS